MTCIVGIEHDEKVWIGGDSAGSDGMSLTIRADEKVWADKGFVFGFTGSFRMGQLLRYKLVLALERHEVPADDAAAEIKYMSTAFIDSVRTVLKEGGYAKVENGNESGGVFLVGWRGKLYQVHSDFQVGRAAQGFGAIGSGGSWATGVLYALRDSKDTPESKILAALDAAKELTPYVRGPFKVVADV
jgi:ATP-dependent protease HslVU (ClpYQ) peptidase subunit